MLSDLSHKDGIEILDGNPFVEVVTGEDETGTHYDYVDSRSGLVVAVGWQSRPIGGLLSGLKVKARGEAGKA